MNEWMTGLDERVKWMDGCDTTTTFELTMPFVLPGRSKAARQTRPCYQGPRPYRLSWWCDPSSR